MAGVAKVTLNGTTLIDVTGKTVSAGTMVSGTTALDKKGDSVTGTIANKSSTDLTASGSTVTVPAGYYSTQATKNVTAGTAFAPAITITSSTGVVTGTNTFAAGYYAASTKTSTINLSTQAAKTITPTETVQRAVSSYYWTTGHISVAAISSTYVGTGITTRSAADLTANASTVTVPAGYYSSQVTKNVASTTHPNPTAAIASSTGVVTATHTQTAGYVAAGTTTGTLNLTTQAAQTINTSTADQTIASYRWLTGTQTIKSVTTTNLTAANIAEGVTVKVGDANNASRITQVVGTHSGATSYTATISGSGNSSYCYVTYNSTKYYTSGNTFTYKAGDSLTIYCRGNSLTINGDSVTLSSYGYTYTLPTGDITINLSYSSSTSNNIKIWGLVLPTGTYTVTAGGTHNVYKYSAASVETGTAFAPAITLASSTGVVTGTNIFAAGYYTASTKTSTFNLTTQAAQTINTSTADQTIASYRWLTGTQTIKSVTTANITAANIKSGITIKVGDANNASRITQVTGTCTEQTYTIKLRKNVLKSDGYVQYGNTKYTTAGDTFQVTPGSSITIYLGYGGYNSIIYIIEGTTVTANQGSLYTYTPTGNCEIDWELENIGGGDYDLYGYIYTNIYPLTYRGTYTWNPASYNTTISSGTLLTGDQTILSVTTTNLTAANIKSGVTIKVGDANNASRITQVTGTYEGGVKVKITDDSTGHSTYCYVQYNSTIYYTAGNEFTFTAGDTLICHCAGDYSATIYKNGEVIVSGQGSQQSGYHASYNLTLPNCNVTIKLVYSNRSPSIYITEDVPTYDDANSRYY